MSGDPSSNPPVTSMRFEGAHDVARHYGEGDVVTSGGATYVCIVPNVNKVPPSAVYWTALGGAGGGGIAFGAAPNVGDELIIEATDPGGIAIATTDPNGGLGISTQGLAALLVLTTLGANADIDLTSARSVHLVALTGDAVLQGVIANVGGSVGVNIQNDPTPGATLGFFSAPGAVQPVLPAVGVVALQDVVDALVAFGLVTQAP